MREFKLSPHVQSLSLELLSLLPDGLPLGPNPGSTEASNPYIMCLAGIVNYKLWLRSMNKNKLWHRGMNENKL